MPVQQTILQTYSPVDVVQISSFNQHYGKRSSMVNRALTLAKVESREPCRIRHCRSQSSGQSCSRYTVSHKQFLRRDWTWLRSRASILMNSFFAQFLCLEIFCPTWGMPLADQVSHANARPSLIQQIQFLQLLKYSKKKSQFFVLARFSISGKNESTFLKSGHDPLVSTQTHTAGLLT